MSAELSQRLQATLGPGYRVERELGGGGMSRIFVVEETELGRRVVVKVLPPDLAAGLSVDRFKREIQLAAQLQHPHIVPLLAAGAKDGLLYYSMPFIQGESVRARLARHHELPIPDVVRILRDVVDALSYAHAHDVVHRDIKPDNILMSGHHAVVTDFGVSKALSTSTGESRITSVGIALGTPAYMSPEQAAAEPDVDHRADIYAVGAVAYELLTGRPPFTGMGPQQVLAAHITQAPEAVTRHRESVSPGLEQLVMRCLEKRPSDRWQSADDLLAQLEVLATPSGGTVPVTRRQARSPSTWWGAAASGFVALALVATTALWWWQRTPAAYVVGTTTQVTNAPGLELDAAISPDGKFVAYAAGPLGRLRIYVKPLTGGRTVSLTDSVPGTHRTPRWTADGNALTYVAGGTLYRVPMMGGDSEALFESYGYEFSSPALSPDGQLVAYADADAVYVRASRGGAPRKVASARYPNSIAWSADGRKLAFVADNPWFVHSRSMLGNIAPSAIWTVNLDRGTQTRVTSVSHLNAAPIWMQDGGALLYVSSTGGARDMYQQPLTAEGVARGAALRLTSGLNLHTISVSADGSRLTYTTFATRSNVWWAPISPGGTTSSSTARALTDENQNVEGLDVSRDGKWLAYDSNRSGLQQIFRIATTGGEPVQLTKDSSDNFMPTWSPDGKSIAFHGWRGGQRDILVMNADGRNATNITETTHHEMFPHWAPDGRQLSFTSDQSGRYEVHASRRAGDGSWSAPRKLTSVGGRNGRWSPDGKWVVFLRLTDSVAMLAPSGAGDARVLFDGHPLGLTPLNAEWLPDDPSRVIIHTVDKDLRHAFWAVPIASGAPRLVLNFENSVLQPRRGEFCTDGRRLYFTIASDESDVWMMELRKP